MSSMDGEEREWHAVLDEVLGLDISRCAVHVCAASYIANEDIPVFQRLQLTEDLTQEFRTVISDALVRWRKEKKEQQLVLWPHMDGTQPQSYEFEHLDLDTHDEIKAQLEGLTGPIIGLPVFTADDDVVSGIRFYAISVQPPVGSPVHFFRTYTPKREISRSHWFAALLRNGQFDAIHTPTFLFDNRIDCFSVRSHMFVVQKTNFQAIFQFFERVAEAAAKTLAIIESRIPILNFDQFAHDCQGHVQKLAKLKNIAQQPYLSTINMDDIRAVIHQAKLDIRIEKVNGTEMLVYDRGDRWALLRLLDNHYMQSLLTKGIYDASSTRLISADRQYD